MGNQSNLFSLIITAQDGHCDTDLKILRLQQYAQPGSTSIDANVFIHLAFKLKSIAFVNL